LLPIVEDANEGKAAGIGEVVMPRQAASAAAEKVRRGLCKKIDVLFCQLSFHSSHCSNHVYILSILYCRWSHQSIILFIFANTTRNRSVPSMWWMMTGCFVLSRLSRCKLVVMVD
jgi:hypothetical protein